MTSDQRPPLTGEAAQKFVVDARPWMSCDECFERLDEFVDIPEAGIGEWAPAMRAHLDGCPACRDEVESLRQLIQSDV